MRFEVNCWIKCIQYGKQDWRVFHGKEIVKLDCSRPSCPDLCGNLVKQQKAVTSFLQRKDGHTYWRPKQTWASQNSALHRSNFHSPVTKQEVMMQNRWKMSSKAFHHLSSVCWKTTTIFHSCLTRKQVIEWISLLAQRWKRNAFHWKQLSYQERACSLGYYACLGLWITGSPSAEQYLNRIKYECTLKPILCCLKTHADKWMCETLLRPTNVGNIELSNCSGFINKLRKVDHYG